MLRLDREQAISVAAFVLAACPAAALAQQPTPPPLTIKQLTPDVWVGLGGAGGNSTIILERPERS